jgi:hypothetical protein
MKYKNLQNLDKNQCKYWFKNQQLKAIMSFPFPWNYILFALTFIIPISGILTLILLYK